MLTLLSFWAFLAAIDPSQTQYPLRELLKDLPQKGDLIVGTADAEVPFHFEFEWGDPIKPDPEIHMANSQLTWIDSFRLKDGSSMTIGKKKVELGCILVLGNSLPDLVTGDKDYLIELFLYPTHARCETAEASQPNPNWLRFTYNTRKPRQVLGPEFSHLYNRFNAVHVTGTNP